MTSLDIQKAYVGGTEVDKIYLGDEVIWSGNTPTPTPSGYTAMPLTFEILSGGTIGWQSTAGTARDYCVNDGSWTTINSGSSFSVVSGDIVQFKANMTTYFDGFICSAAPITCNVYGNIMSMVDKDNYATLKQFPGGDAHFQNFFLAER